jgi:hypothetical protein
MAVPAGVTHRVIGQVDTGDVLPPPHNLRLAATVVRGLAHERR